MTRFLILLIFSISFFHVKLAYSQSIDRNVALKELETIEKNGRYVDKLNDALSQGSGSRSYNLPIAVKNKTGDISLSFIISSIKLSPEYGEATAYVVLELPSMRSTDKQSTYIVFGAPNIKISYTGDLVGDTQLALLSDMMIPVGNMRDLIIKGGGIDSTGHAINSNTFLSVDCRGDFKELSFDGILTLNKNTFTAATSKGDSTVNCRVQTSIMDLNDLLIEVDLPPFKIKNIPDFIFTVSKASLDLSDKRNPSSFYPDPDYMSEYFTLPDKNLWRGLYIHECSVTFPSMFNMKGTDKKTTIGFSDLLIDENGITGDFLAKNILTIQSGLGDATGCPFSVSNFYLSFIANDVKRFGFGGEMGIPFASNNAPRPYNAWVDRNGFRFNMSLGDSVDVKLIGNNSLRLSPTSSIEVAVHKGKFAPKLVEMDISNIKTSIIDGRPNQRTEVLLRKIGRLSVAHKDTLMSMIMRKDVSNLQTLDSVRYEITKEDDLSEIIKFHTESTINIDINMNNGKGAMIDQSKFTQLMAHELLHHWWAHFRGFDKLKWIIIRDKQPVYGYLLSDQLATKASRRNSNRGCSQGAGHERNNPEHKMVCEDMDKY